MEEHWVDYFYDIFNIFINLDSILEHPDHKLKLLIFKSIFYNGFLKLLFFIALDLESLGEKIKAKFN